LCFIVLDRIQLALASRIEAMALKTLNPLYGR
jgi:hypothetical protein